MCFQLKSEVLEQGRKFWSKMAMPPGLNIVTSPLGCGFT